MKDIKGITVSVEYDDYLAVTLPRALRHFDSVLVVTSPSDERTQRLVEQYEPNALSYVTDAFYRNGATFNKGLAIEEGFDVLGREGWITVWDADIVIPRKIDLSGLTKGFLHSPRRRVCGNPREWKGGEVFTRWPLFADQEHAGYFQLFHADDPVLQRRPWYGVNWRHAGGCDSDFQELWPPTRKRWLPFEVLHLGPVGMNWHGRAGQRLDGIPIPEAPRRAALHRQVARDRSRFGYRHEKL